jgi:hypothetical protein
VLIFLIQSKIAHENELIDRNLFIVHSSYRVIKHNDKDLATNNTFSFSFICLPLYTALGQIFFSFYLEKQLLNLKYPLSTIK